MLQLLRAQGVTGDPTPLIGFYLRLVNPPPLSPPHEGGKEGGMMSDLRPYVKARLTQDQRRGLRFEQQGDRYAIVRGQERLELDTMATTRLVMGSVSTPMGSADCGLRIGNVPPPAPPRMRGGMGGGKRGERGGGYTGWVHRGSGPRYYRPARPAGQTGLLAGTGRHRLRPLPPAVPSGAILPARPELPLKVVSDALDEFSLAQFSSA